MAITRISIEVHFSIFLSSTYSPIEYCAGSTEKMKFPRHPAAPVAAAMAANGTIYVSVSRDMELNIQSLRVLAFHNLNFILIAHDISYILIHRT